jgi:hypothetical protein
MQSAMLKLHTPEKAPPEKARAGEGEAKPAKSARPPKTGEAPVAAEQLAPAAAEVDSKPAEQPAAATEKKGAFKSLFKKFLPDQN